MPDSQPAADDLPAAPAPTPEAQAAPAPSEAAESAAVAAAPAAEAAPVEAGPAGAAGGAAPAEGTSEETTAETADKAALATAAPTAPRPPELSPAACAAKLAELFPALFGPEGPPKPLKLRIQADIQQRAPGLFSKRVLSLFLSRYTTGNAYIRALLQATTRFDLDGQPAGEISEEHRLAATEELARRRAISEERRAAERAAVRTNQREAQRAAEQAARQQHQAAQADHQARRERAFVLRAFETSSLTKANFCVLKGVTEAELDAQLDLARKERDERPPMPAERPAPRNDHRGPGPGLPDRTDRPDRAVRRDARPPRGGPPRGPRPT